MRVKHVFELALGIIYVVMTNMFMLIIEDYYPEYKHTAYWTVLFGGFIFGIVVRKYSKLIFE